jgi:peptidoglycan/LPS O-acetylase OafA/YrhL
MLLGLVLHGVLPFKATGIGQYPLRDCHTHVLADAIYFAVHDFRMQLFFTLAGFAAAALATRKGLGELVRNRVRRIVLPLLIVVPLIAPVMHVLFTCHTAAVRARPGPVSWTTVVTDLDLGAWLGPNYHLWFLYVLVICYLPLAGWWAVGPRLVPGAVRRTADAVFRRLLGSGWKALILAALGVPLLWPMADWHVETPQGWLPDPVVVVYYLGFFLFGAMLFRHRDLLPGYGRRWPVLLASANLLLLPAMLRLSVSGNWIEAEAGSHPPAWLPLWKAAALVLVGLYTWLMVEGLIGFFQRFFPGRRPVWAYLTEASYWCYLAGFPVQVALQVWLADHPMSIASKLLVVNGITFAVLLTSYELGVRHTWVGLLLNGKRPEPKAPVPVLEPVVLAARVRVGSAERLESRQQTQNQVKREEEETVGRAR